MSTFYPNINLQNTGTITIINTTDSSSTSTGSIITSGGVGITKNLFVGNSVTASTLISTVSTGTAPLTVTSTTNIPNLNASSLNGNTFLSPGAIGSGTPSTGAFTSITVTSSSNVANLNSSTVNGFTFVNPGAIGSSTAATTIAASSTVTLSGVTDSTSTGTGILQVSGGVGIVKSLYVGLNAYANNHINGYSTTATAAGTTVLTVSSAQQQYFTGSTTQTVTLPVASTLTLGQSFTIVNNSSGVVTVQSSGANSIKAMVADSTLIVTCILTSGTTAASWNSSYTTDTGLPDLSSPGPIGSTTASSGAFTTLAASGVTSITNTTAIGATVNPTTSSGGSLNVGGDLVLGASIPRIYFPGGNVGNPSYTNRSNGTKLVLLPNISSSNTEYAIGVGSSANLWFNVPSNGSGNIFQWYGGTISVMTLDGTGNLSVLGTTDSSSSTTGALIVSGGLGITKSLYIGSVTNLAYNGGTLGSQLRIANNNSEYLAFYGDASNNYWIQPSIGNRNITVQASGSGGFFCNSISSFLNTTDSSSTTTGALIVSGGLGIAKSLYVGSIINNSYFKYQSTNIGTNNTWYYLGSSPGVAYFELTISERINLSSPFWKKYQIFLRSAGGTRFYQASNMDDNSNPTYPSTLVVYNDGTNYQFFILTTPAVGVSVSSVINSVFSLGNWATGPFTTAEGSGTTPNGSSSGYTGTWTLQYNSSTSAFGPTIMGQLTISTTTDSSSSTTGALIVSGGVGIAKNLYVGTMIHTAGTSVTGNPATNHGSQLYIESQTFTDNSTAISGTNSTFMAGTFLNSPTFASTNATTILTNAATLYITGPASAGTNVTLTNPYALYVNSGNSYFGNPIQLPSTAWVGLGVTNTSILANSSGAGTFVSNSVPGDLILRSAVNIRLGISTGTSVFDVLSGQAVVNPTTDSSSTTTGSLIVSGGVGIAKSLNVGTSVTASTLVSTVSTGTAPFTISSTTNVANLNASSLNSATFASPGAIGSTTASTGAFTTLTASNTTDSTSITTGALQVSGGVGISKNLFVGTMIRTSGTTVTGNPTTNNGSQLYISSQTFTDSSTTASGTNGTLLSGTYINAPIFAATNSSVTTTNAASLYISGAAAAGTNNTVTNSWSLYVNSGTSYFGSGFTVPSSAWISFGLINSSVVGNSSGSGSYFSNSLVNDLILRSTSNIRLGIGANPSSNTSVLDIVSGQAVFNPTTDSSSSTTGALVISGGVGIAKNLYVGGTLNVTSTTTLGDLTFSNYSSAPGSRGGSCLLTRASFTYTDSTTAASSTNSFAISTVYINQSTFAATNTSVTTTTASSLYIVGPPLNGTNNTITNPYSLLIGTGQVSIQTTTDSSSTGTGALIVSGGVGIAKKLVVGTTINVPGMINQSSRTYTYNGTVANASAGVLVFNFAASFASFYGKATIIQQHQTNFSFYSIITFECSCSGQATFNTPIMWNEYFYNNGSNGFTTPTSSSTTPSISTTAGGNITYYLKFEILGTGGLSSLTQDASTVSTWNF